MSDLFYNVVLPGRYGYGATFGPRFKTNIVMVNSGKEKRNADWQDALWEISLNYTTQRPEEAQDLENLFLQTKGPLIPFLFDSKKDNTILQDQGIANSDGVLKGSPKFRLFKSYVYDLTLGRYSKRIFKPQPDTIKIFNNNVEVDWEVDYLNGVVELPLISSKHITNISKATNAIITCNSHGFNSNDKIFLDDITGMTQLNKMVVTINNVIDSNNFSININTLAYSDFTDNLNLNFAKKYISGTENITWSGKFFLPVRFKEDVITTSYDNFKSLSLSATLVEIRLDEVDELELDN